jgi:hypothetical protein
VTASALARAEGLLRFAEASEEAPAPHADDFDEADGDLPATASMGSGSPRSASAARFTRGRQLRRRPTLPASRSLTSCYSAT